MDPWISSAGESTPAAPADLELHNNPITSSPDNSSQTTTTTTTRPLSFEDDFQPTIPSSEASQSFSKLPDSDQYLASLEKKLEKVQKGGKKKEPAASRILQGLSETRESCMLKLLSNSVADGDKIEEFLSDEVKVNLVLKKLAPEKQAISAEELIHLLKADQLELVLSEGDLLSEELHKPEK